MRIRDLIPNKDALITPEYYKRQNQAVRTDTEARTSTTVSQNKLTGDVRNLADEINWDYAVIERLNRNDLIDHPHPVQPRQGDPRERPVAEPAARAGRHRHRLLQDRRPGPRERRAVVVSLEGEFAHAGVYQAQKTKPCASSSCAWAA